MRDYSVILAARVRQTKYKTPHTDLDIISHDGFTGVHAYAKTSRCLMLDLMQPLTHRR